MEVYEELIYIYDLNEEYIFYMGDDVFDYLVMWRVGFLICFSNVVLEIMELVYYIFFYEGGSGCVCDVIEKVLKLNGYWLIKFGFEEEEWIVKNYCLFKSG